jgi:aldose 1-epimerase
MESDKTVDGSDVRLFTITNKSGSSVRLMTYGAAVDVLKVPDRIGKFDDVVLGFDTVTGYFGNNPYFGAIVGRFANRIHRGTFVLNGVQYHIPANDRGNSLHGGPRGFDKVIWTGAKIDDQTVDFTYLSKDGEEGFPGNLTVNVRYSLSDANELTIDYTATTDKDTVINLTNHCYFNLAGAGNGDVLDHEVSIDAAQYMPIDATAIPTGPLDGVAGTPFDFQAAHKIGARIGAGGEQLKFGGGYDHNYVLTPKKGLRFAATVCEPTTGRVLEIRTTEPAIQFYSGNGLNGSIMGKGGKKYAKHAAFCLEPQHYPDSPNHPEYPTTVLKAGGTYRSTSVYKFSTRSQ